MQTWPAGVPEINLLDAYAETPLSNRAEFQPEVGPPKRRRRMSISMSKIPFAFHATEAELDAFIAWYEDDLKDGTLEFEREHPRTLATNVFVFATEYSVTAVSTDLFRVSFELTKIF